MCLRFAYLVAVRVIPTLRLWWRGDEHKTIEILLLRHQLSVLQRELAASGKRPRPDWADRAMIALLLGLVPKARQYGDRHHHVAALRTFRFTAHHLRPAAVPPSSRAHG